MFSYISIMFDNMMVDFWFEMVWMLMIFNGVFYVLKQNKNKWLAYDVSRSMKFCWWILFGGNIFDLWWRSSRHTVNYCMRFPIAVVCRARLPSSSVIRCSIRYCAVFICPGVPVIVTIRFRVPGAKIPFFDICILAPLKCCISINDRPPGPRKN